MAIIVERPNVTLQVSLLLSEEEALALHELACWSIPETVQAIASEIGGSFGKDHAPGIKSLLQSAREHLPGIVQRMNDARKVFRGEAKIARPIKSGTE